MENSGQGQDIERSDWPPPISRDRGPENIGTAEWRDWYAVGSLRLALAGLAAILGFYLGVYGPNLYQSSQTAYFLVIGGTDLCLLLSLIAGLVGIRYWQGKAGAALAFSLLCLLFCGCLIAH